MNLEEIKKAAKSKKLDTESLVKKLIELKEKNISFLGCLAFVQHNQNITLKQAQELTLKIDAYTKEEKTHIKKTINLMLSEFEEE